MRVGSQVEIETKNTFECKNESISIVKKLIGNHGVVYVGNKEN